MNVTSLLRADAFDNDLVFSSSAISASVNCASKITNKSCCCEVTVSVSLEGSRSHLVPKGGYRLLRYRKIISSLSALPLCEAERIKRMDQSVQPRARQRS